MSTRMLIDARHEEETRVTIVRGNRIDEFDYESAHKQQIKGNVYLAKITRVEPSLQAAFVEYGGNRHGFLAFSEIHPDYYQIPTADREALLAEEAEASRQIDELAEEVPEETAANKQKNDGDDDDEEDDTPQSPVEQIAGEDEVEESLRRNKLRNLRRRYKIQEVIKRRQILLVQVVREERGTKGAALTSYLSLPGRYCVLMPNTTHGGGISRKIAATNDRKRLKEIVQSLDIPDGIGCIIRTAGASHTKAEIKRDYDYLLRQWEDIRALTLKSVAPALIYEEGNLVKRAIRDHYTKDIDEILIDGEEGYRLAKDFMKLLIPSHAKKVKQYKDKIPLFQRYQVESQLDSMYSPDVSLKSGGYIVINPTEALVSIDVNSGKATKEHNIEETALNTNLEAADEIARQLRLRDMAGLIVIDFIDMDYRKNNRTVERRMKDALKNDRARIQLGRISSFGLMEMSRQRLRPGILEASTSACKVCHGTGRVRSIESFALHILRLIEEECIRGKKTVITMDIPTDTAVYILNKKRDSLSEIEKRYDTAVEITARADLTAPQYEIRQGTASDSDTGRKKTTQAPERRNQPARQQGKEQDGTQKSRRRRGGRRRNNDQQNTGTEPQTSQSQTSQSQTSQSQASQSQASQSQASQSQTSQSQTSQSQTSQSQTSQSQTSQSQASQSQTGSDALVQDSPPTIPGPEGNNTEGVKRKRRRGRRGGRKQASRDQHPEQSSDTPVQDQPTIPDKKPVQAETEKPAEVSAEAKSPETDTTGENQPKRTPRRQPHHRAQKQKTNGIAETDVRKSETAPVQKPVENTPEPTPTVAVETTSDKPKKGRKGWWQRPFN